MVIGYSWSIFSGAEIFFLQAMNDRAVRSRAVRRAAGGQGRSGFRVEGPGGSLLLECCTTVMEVLIGLTGGGCSCPSAPGAYCFRGHGGQTEAKTCHIFVRDSGPPTRCIARLERCLARLN